MMTKDDAKTPQGEAGLSHVNEAGEAHMVDVSTKAVSVRWAKAQAVIHMAPSTAQAIADNQVAKGDVLAVARLAGIMAAKETHRLIPLCHPLPLDHIEVVLTVLDDHVRIETTARTAARTGVEMEALTAASVAALTIYDMAKSMDRGMHIGPVALLEKHGGTRGPWSRESHG
jgi:cyclic pyranopterin phosphate synthase